MPQNKPQRLSQVIGTFAPQGANDRRWLLIEYLLEATVLSARSVVSTLEAITAWPENAREGYEADDCLGYMRHMLCDILEARASFQSYLSGTDVPERISRKEL